MDYVTILMADLEKGYSKSDLERLIGLPKNNLSGILKGDRVLSKKSKLKIEKWEASKKPSPIDMLQGGTYTVKELGINAAPVSVPQNSEDDYQTRMEKQRIVELQKELNNPPKSAIIGVKNWIKAREEELSLLKDKYGI